MAVAPSLTTLFLFIAPLLNVDETTSKRPLSMNMWIPIGTLDTLYWFYFFYQMIHFASTVCIGIGIDLLFSGLILSASHQFDLLAMRAKILSDISNLPNSKQFKVKMENIEIKKIVQHHLLISE